jgi:hypothetical protein
MRPSSGKRVRTLATVALLVTLLAAVGIAGLGAFARGGSGASLAAPHAVAPMHVSAPQKAVAPSLGNVSVAVTITNTPQAYILLPYTISWDVSVTNGSVTAGSTWMSITILDINNAGTCVSVFFGVAPCPTVVNVSANSSVATGVTSYSQTITSDDVLSAGYNGGVLPADQFQILVWVTVNNGVNNATFGGQEQAFIVPSLPSGSFIAPSSTGALSPGNATIAINYSGNYVNGATVTVYAGTDATGKVVYSQGVFVPGVGSHIVSTVWTVVAAGSYFGVLNVHAPYGQWNFTAAWSVNAQAGGGTVYQNTTTWINTTTTTTGGTTSLISGLSNGAAGALLLVVGLIVGMIVALALGRSMWGGSKPAPAQAWQAKAGNECSVCHQTFATEAELKDHQKSAHGM